MAGSKQSSLIRKGDGDLEGYVGGLSDEAAVLSGPAPAGRLLERHSGDWFLSAKGSQQTKGKSHMWDLPDDHLRVPAAISAATVEIQKEWGGALLWLSPRGSHTGRNGHEVVSWNL